jgi:hypothetical protein
MTISIKGRVLDRYGPGRMLFNCAGVRARDGDEAMAGVQLGIFRSVRAERAGDMKTNARAARA